MERGKKRAGNSFHSLESEKVRIYWKNSIQPHLEFWVLFRQKLHTLPLGKVTISRNAHVGRWPGVQLRTNLPCCLPGFSSLSLCPSPNMETTNPTYSIVSYISTIIKCFVGAKSFVYCKEVICDGNDSFSNQSHILYLEIRWSLLYLSTFPCNSSKYTPSCWSVRKLWKWSPVGNSF